MRFVPTTLILTLLAAPAFAEPHHDLGEARTVVCASASGRTVTRIDRAGTLYRVTTVQDRRRVLHPQVATVLAVQESFPETFRYQGRTSGNDYVVLGQTTQDFQNFSPVQGRVHYVKQGISYQTPVQCQVYY